MAVASSAEDTGTHQQTPVEHGILVLLGLHVWVASLLYRSRPSGLWVAGLASAGYVVLGVAMSGANMARLMAATPFAFIAGYCAWRVACPACEVEAESPKVTSPPPASHAERELGLCHEQESEPPDAAIAGGADRQASVAAGLSTLSDMYQAGVLSEDEYCRAKDRLLGKVDGGKP